jgi:cysteine desulfurase family protein
MSIYLDNAATSFPKPPSVYEAVQHALKEIGASPGRGAYRLAREASAIISDCREKAARLLGISNPNRVLFTTNATESINVVLKGWLSPGDRVLISSMEHNAVVRPLKRLNDRGVQVEKIPCDQGGQMDVDALECQMDPPPRLVVLIHASNVNGGLQPVAEVARLCNERNIPLLLDAAQTAGVQPIFVEEWKLGMLACSGHKALLGPPGVGILYVRPDLNVLPLIEGGTGSRSEEEVQPEFCPDRYESGTLNLAGIAGLGAGIEFILKKGINTIGEHEIKLASTLEQRLAEFPGVHIYRPEVRGTGAVSFTVQSMNPADVGYLLDKGFDIAVRTGLHCAPLAHGTIGTFPEGTVRVSPGYASTKEEIQQFLEALDVLLSRRRIRLGGQKVGKV